MNSGKGTVGTKASKSFTSKSGLTCSTIQTRATAAEILKQKTNATGKKPGKCLNCFVSHIQENDIEE